MPQLRIADHSETPQDTFRFPVEIARSHSENNQTCGNTEDVLEALENVSRRIDDLARELNCLGWFDDDDDRPRAA